MIIDGNHITAEEGKVFRRKGTDEIFGNEIFLGYSYCIDGVVLDTPHLDTPEDFEEVDDYSDEAITAEEALGIITGM